MQNFNILTSPCSWVDRFDKDRFSQDKAHLIVQVHSIYSKYSKNWYTFLFLLSNKMLVIRVEIYKMVVKKANREDTDQQSGLGLHCLSRNILEANLCSKF